MNLYNFCNKIVQRLTIEIILRHVEPILPYVSDLGVILPSAVLFTCFMCSIALLMSYFVILRFHLNKRLLHKTISKRNRTQLITGIMIVISMSAIGSFRNAENYFIQIVHNVMASILFLMLAIDILLAIEINQSISDQESIIIVQKILLFLCLLFSFTVVVGAFISFRNDPWIFFHQHRRLHWSSKQIGYYGHLLSTVSEWVLILMSAPYLFTYGKHFKRFLFEQNQSIIPERIDAEIDCAIRVPSKTLLNVSS